MKFAATPRFFPKAFAAMILALAAGLVGCATTGDTANPSLNPPANPGSPRALPPLIEAPKGRALIVWQRDEGHDYFLNNLHIGWKSPVFDAEQALWYFIRDYRAAEERQRNNQFPGHAVFDPRRETSFVTTLLPGSYQFMHYYSRSAVISWSGPTQGERRLDTTLSEGQVLFGHLPRSGAITLSSTPPADWTPARIGGLRTFDNQERIDAFFRHRMWRSDEVAITLGPDGCPYGDVALRWTNARFAGVFLDCLGFTGQLDFDNGARLDVLRATLGQQTGQSDRLETAVYTDSDGTRYRGNFTLADAQGTPNEHLLQPPRLHGMGHQVRPGGMGVLGGFVDGQAHGEAWCFTVLSGEGCVFDNGQRLADTGMQRRAVADILSLEPGLPPSMTVDLLRQRQIAALLGERWAEFLQLEADLAVLGVDTGIEALFYVGRALKELGRHEAAFQRIQAYLNIAGAAGASYGEALSLFADLRPRADAARQDRLSREGEAQGERERFCQAAQTQGESLCGCREFPALAIPMGDCA